MNNSKHTTVFASFSNPFSKAKKVAKKLVNPLLPNLPPLLFLFQNWLRVDNLISSTVFFIKQASLSCVLQTLKSSSGLMYWMDKIMVWNRLVEINYFCFAFPALFHTPVVPLPSLATNPSVAAAAVIRSAAHVQQLPTGALPPQTGAMAASLLAVSSTPPSGNPSCVSPSSFSAATVRRLSPPPMGAQIRQTPSSSTTPTSTPNSNPGTPTSIPISQSLSKDSHNKPEFPPLSTSPSVQVTPVLVESQIQRIAETAKALVESLPAPAGDMKQPNHNKKKVSKEVEVIDSCLAP